MFPVSPFILVATLAVTLLSIVLFRVYFHALSKIPGPKLAAVSTLWLAYHARQAKMNSFQPALHKKYGPIVRIAPNQVIICSEEAVRKLYSAGSAYVKGPWYQVCAAPGSRSRKGQENFDLLTEMDIEKYRMQRRAIGPAYSVSGLEKHEKQLDSFVSRYISALKERSGSWVDLSEWMHIFALDAISTFTLSKSAGYTDAGNDGGNMAASNKIWRYFTIVGLFPWLIELTQGIPKVGMFFALPIALFFCIPIPTGIPIISFAYPEVIERLGKQESTSGVEIRGRRPGMVFNKEKKESANNAEKENAEEEEEGDEDLVGTLMRLHTDKAEKFPPYWVLAMSLTTFGAGHDTTTITLTSCIYHICSNSSVRARLVRELAEAKIPTGSSSYNDIVNRVPYLLACVKEAMRLWPAIGSHLQRIVPASGATLSFKYLPPGTIVGVNMYAVHQDPAIWGPNAEKFRPERWMNDDGSEQKRKEIGRLEGVWLGFGGGSRSCPGQHLARMLVVKCLVGIFGEDGFGQEVEVKGEPNFRGWFSCHVEGLGVKFGSNTAPADV